MHAVLHAKRPQRVEGGKYNNSLPTDGLYTNDQHIRAQWMKFLRQLWCICIPRTQRDHECAQALSNVIYDANWSSMNPYDAFSEVRRAFGAIVETALFNNSLKLKRTDPSNYKPILFRVVNSHGKESSVNMIIIV